MNGLDGGAEPGVGSESAERVDHEGELGFENLGEGGVESDENVLLTL